MNFAVDGQLVHSINLPHDRALGLKTIGRIVNGCVFVLLALLLATIVVEKIVRWVKVYRFRRRFRGKSLLICSRRHGWYDFIMNNVVPGLPADCTVEWTESFPACARTATTRPSVGWATRPTRFGTAPRFSGSSSPLATATASPRG